MISGVWSYFLGFKGARNSHHLELLQGLNSKGCGGEMGRLLHCPETICFWTLSSLGRPQEGTQVGLLASLHNTLSEAKRNIMCSVAEGTCLTTNLLDVAIGHISSVVLYRDFS